MKNLIYASVFFDPKFINLFELLLQSIKLYGTLDPSTTDILLLTDMVLQPRIEEVAQKIGIRLKYHLLTVTEKWESSAARLHIFEYPSIDTYDTILYIDTDVLVNKDINVLLNLHIHDDKLYAVPEGQIGCSYWGGEFFSFDNKPYTKETTAFCAGILLFKNSQSMKDLFTKINNHIHQYVFVEQHEPPHAWEQPFLVYNAVNDDKYDNTFINNYCRNNKFFIESSDLVLYHFPCGPGDYQTKYENMLHFAVLQHEFYHPEILPTLVGNGEVHSPNWVFFYDPGRIIPRTYLEIGADCGRNVVMFERLFGRHKDSKIYAIDTWDNYSTEYGHCLTNIVSTGRGHKFNLIRGAFHEKIITFQDSTFDIIYINETGSTKAVIENAVLCFRKLKVGGCLVFNGYYFECVKKGVDLFTSSYGDNLSWMGITCGQNAFRKQ